MRNTKYFRSNYEFITADHNVIFARMIIMRTCVPSVHVCECVRVCVRRQPETARKTHTFTCKYSFHIYYNIRKLPRVVYLFKELIWISFCLCHLVHLHLVCAQVNVSACASCIMYIFILISTTERHARCVKLFGVRACVHYTNTAATTTPPTIENRLRVRRFIKIKVCTNSYSQHQCQHHTLTFLS